MLMLSEAIYNGINMALEQIASASEFAQASTETLMVADRLSRMEFNSQIDDRTQVITMMQTLQKILELSTNPQPTDPSDKDAEAGMSAEAVEINIALREKFNLTINIVATEIAKTIGMDIDPGDTIEPNELLDAIQSNKTNFKFKNVENYQKLSDVTDAESSGKFSHVTARVQKIPKAGETPREKHQATWFQKLVSGSDIAGREVVAQEFYRLLMPYQPKTRIATDANGNVFVVSKGLVDATCMQDLTIQGIRVGLLNNWIVNFGKVCAVNQYLEEVDAKYGNMYVDNNTGNLLKIDGDWCFASLRDKRYEDQTDVTQLTIAMLPLTPTYQACNWMDLYQEGTLNNQYLTQADNVTLSQDLGAAPAFRQEVNEGLLHILLIDADLRSTFIRSYIHDPREIDLLRDTLSQRYAQTYNAAIFDPSFQAYMQSPAAAKYMEECIKLTSEFVTTGKNFLAPDKDELTAQFQEVFQKLKVETAPRQIHSSAAIMGQLLDAKQLDAKQVDAKQTDVDLLYPKQEAANQAVVKPQEHNYRYFTLDADSSDSDYDFEDEPSMPPLKLASSPDDIEPQNLKTLDKDKITEEKTNDVKPDEPDEPVIIRPRH